MKKYNVRLYPICCVMVYNVEAESYEDAIQKAHDYVPFNQAFPDAIPFQDPEHLTWATFGPTDGDDGALVDVVGDHARRESRHYNSEGQWVIQGHRVDENGQPLPLNTVEQLMALNRELVAAVLLASMQINDVKRGEGELQLADDTLKSALANACEKAQANP